MSDPSTYGESLADIYDDLYGEAPANAIDALVALALSIGLLAWPLFTLMASLGGLGVVVMV